MIDQPRRLPVSPIPALLAGLSLLGAAVALPLPARAATRALSPAGLQYSVAAEPRSSGIGGSSGTKVVFRSQSPDAAAQAWVLPGTDDAVTDVEPALAVCPASGLPVVAWSRPDAAGHQIFVSLYDGARWSAPRALTADARGHRRPQLQCGASGRIHLMWTAGLAADGSPLFYEAVLDEKGASLLPAGQVRARAGVAISPARTSPTVFSEGDLLFAFEAGSKNGPVVVAFGGLDEPIPIDRRVDVETQQDASTIENTRIAAVGDRIALLFLRAGRLYYSVQSAGGWSPLRSIVLDGITEEQAEILVRNASAIAPTP